jgi:hypothetical protein
MSEAITFRVFTKPYRHDRRGTPGQSRALPIAGFDRRRGDYGGDTMTVLRLQLRWLVLAREKGGPVTWRTQLEQP